MIGTQVVDTDGVVDAIATERFDLSGYDAFIERQLGASQGGASERFVEPLPAAMVRASPGEVIPFRPMSATTEVPAAFRNAAGDRGPLDLIREGIGDIRSRRRLVRYLVQADIRKRGADTAARQPLVGPRPAPPDARLRRLRVDHRAGGDSPDYPLFIFSAILPWKWFSASVTDATTSIVSQDQLIKQIQFPKLVLPVAATTAGVVGFAFGTVALGMLMLFFSDRITP